jgi:Invasion associated locus B (IalB) protein
MTRFLALAALALAAPLAARDSLGVYDGWAAFKDTKPLRCYAIAKAQGTPLAPAYATISNWPERKVRGALHLVLSRAVADKSSVRLVVGNERFTLIAKGRNAWAKDPRDDAAIIAALRSAARMSVSASGAKGGTFTDRYSLGGVATAMDAATVACAKRS